MPANGEFNFECSHCSFDSGKTPEKIKGEHDNIKTYFCGQCKEMTLIKIDFGMASIFRLES